MPAEKYTKISRLVFYIYFLKTTYEAMFLADSFGEVIFAEIVLARLA